jgi:hypothetical protein
MMKYSIFAFFKIFKCQKIKILYLMIQNNIEPSAIRITLNGEEQYGLEKIEDTFGNPPKNYCNFVIVI